MRLPALLLALLAALANAGAAHAHASLIRSEPADRAVVAQAPQEVRLTFNEPVSPLALRLAGPDNAVRELSAVAGTTLVVRLPDGLANGTHLLSWRVVSADGHPVGGALTFSVGSPSAMPEMQARSDGRLRAAIWLMRFILYGGMVIGLGGAFYAAWIAGFPTPPRAREIAGAALQCALVALLLSVGLQGIDALGVPPSELKRTRIWFDGLSTAYGATAAIAVAAIAIALAALRWPDRARPLSALAVVGAGAAFAASGHASAAMPLVTRPAVFLHVACVVLWIGALIPLAMALAWPERRAVELARFSRLAPFAVAVLAASGAVLAVIQLRQVDALWTTAYGLVLSGKLAAVTALLALAAVNRYGLTPRIAAGDAAAVRRLGLSIRAEIALALAILALVACWRFTPPPRSLLASASAPVHVHIHAAKAMADIVVEPPRQGARIVRIVLLDGQFAPLDAKELTLMLARPDGGLEPLRWRAVHVSDTRWRVDDVRLPGGGRWLVQLDILVNDFEKVVIEDTLDLPP